MKAVAYYRTRPGVPEASETALHLQSNGPEGYTGTTVNVRRGGFIYTYDERGRQVSTAPAR